MEETTGEDVLDAKDLRSLLERERAARAEAEAASRAKDEFISAIAHELRTPLNAIVGWAQILRSGKLEPEQQARAVDTIDRNARLQVWMIGDLLDVTRIASGRFKLEFQPFELGPIVEAAVDALRATAASRGVTVEVDTGDVAGLTIEADAEHLQQTVRHLLSNAIRFSPKGGRVALRADRTASGGARIAVTDEGQGLDAESIGRIFDDGYTAGKKQGGLGIGLKIVRHVVGAHGGTIDAASEGPQRGATFTVTLPLRPAPAQASA